MKEGRRDRSEPNPTMGHPGEAGGCVFVAVWQFALFVVLLSLTLFVLLPISGPLAAAVVVLLGLFAVSWRRFTGRSQ